MRYESGTKKEVLETAIDMAIQYENDFINSYHEDYLDDEAKEAIEQAEARIRDFRRLLKTNL